MKKPLWASLALAALAACSGWFGGQAEPEASGPAGAGGAAAAAEDPVLVRAEPVRVAPIERRLEATAHVESLDVVDVVAERSEPVVEILVEEGDAVAAGQVLARLREEVARLEVDEARARLLEAQNQLRRAERDHERNRSLAEAAGGTSLLSQRDLDASELALQTARTSQAAAEVALERAEVELRRCTLFSPIAGTVAERLVSVGDMTQLGGRAFRVVDLSRPRAVFFRPERELSSLRVGQELIAASEALPGIAIPGRVERISPVVDPQSGTVKVTALLEPPPGVVVPSGVLVRVTLVLDRRPEALLVPKQALLYEADRVLCFAVRGDPEGGQARAVRIALQPGYEDPQYLEALPSPDGLRPDDRVVVVGADRLSDGAAVQVAAE